MTKRKTRLEEVSQLLSLVDSFFFMEVWGCTVQLRITLVRGRSLPCLRQVASVMEKDLPARARLLVTAAASVPPRALALQKAKRCPWGRHVQRPSSSSLSFAV